MTESSSDPVTWWDNVLICHNSKSINDSYFFWYNNKVSLAAPFQNSGDLTNQTVLTFKDDSKKMNISDPLKNFCQHIHVPVAIPGGLYAAIGLLVTTLFRIYDGTGFNSEDLPFGIKAISAVDFKKHLQLLCKKTQGDQVQLENFHGIVQLHRDEGMLSRGMVNCSIFGTGEVGNFAFMTIVNIKDEAWEKSFYNYPSAIFDTVLATACYVFHHALRHVNDPSSNTEEAILARQIGKYAFEQATKEAPMGEEETKEEAPAASKPKKKRKGKKSKKGRKIVEEEGEEATTIHEGEIPSVVVSPPSPSPSRSEAPPSTSPSKVATSANFLSPRDAVRREGTIVPSAFSFSSFDRRLSCRLGGCTTLANASNPSAVVCPRCTAYSFTRYCTFDHLLVDLHHHFTSGECGSTLIPGAVIDNDPNAVPASCLPVRPYIQELQAASVNQYPKNILERHRQALYRSMHPDISIDYYIFDDIDRITMPDWQLQRATTKMRKQKLQEVRGEGDVYAVVEMPFVDSRKARFDELMDDCLRLGSAAGAMRTGDCLWLYTTIKNEMIEHGLWDARMEERIAVQMGFEFGWKLPYVMRGR